jgi:hypothetical protein
MQYETLTTCSFAKEEQKQIHKFKGELEVEADTQAHARSRN